MYDINVKYLNYFSFNNIVCLVIFIIFLFFSFRFTLVILVHQIKLGEGEIIVK